ncbi:BppU family phage baseplate upper protein [Paeniclostridium sordellii]|uniref:BppU family phage baseplate upper protein n=1 Tax=Paraclostridium sordellii TaxID=1505 RepID=UPI00210AA50B|nr:BppU family phage baseplate upper protein [Paeniclostridium sordellii]MCQ4699077.1 BppU family phage baseplate upper protein [Paeniclostridium sordellii]
MMAVNNFHFKLDIEREDHIPKFRLKQYDTAIFYASLYKNGLPYHFENEQIKMFVKKADGTIVYQEDNITIQDDEVKINVKNQALTASGLTYAELELKSSTGQVTTATFLFEVREKVGSDKAIESITDICTLEKIDRYVGQAKKELDKFKQDLSKLDDLVANKDKLEGQNAEAKVNIKGLERVLEQANNIVSNGGKKVTGNNVISESSNGYIQNLKLTGKTLVNIIPLNPSKWVLGGSGENLGVNAYYSIYLSDLPIKPNTTYSYKLFGLPKKYNAHWFHLTASKLNTSTEGTFTSLSEIGNSFIHLYPIEGQQFTLDDVKNVKVVLVEGNEKIDGYFEGLKSVGDGVDNISLKSSNLNLFDEKLLSSKLEADGYYHFRTTGNSRCDLFMGFVDSSYKQITDMSPNMVLDLSKFDLRNWRFLIGLNGDVKDDKVLIPVEQIGFLNASFFKGCEFIKVDNNHIKVKNIELSLNKTTPSYVPHEESKRNLSCYDSNAKVWEKPILRKWDTIEDHLDNYYYHKRSTLKTLNGSEDWKDNGTTSGECSTFYIRGFSNIKNFKIICDKYNYHTTPKLDTIGISSINDILYLTVKTNYASTVAELKTKLRSNNINLVFEDVEKIYECLNISVRSFNPTTLLSINSGAIDTKVEYYIPSSFVSSDSSISEKLENVDDSLLKLMFDFLNHNHDKRYDLKNLGSVTDFDIALEPGRYYVFKEGGSIPNAPYSGNIYGALEVFHTNDTELIQRFTSANGKIYTRLKNFEGNWWTWSNMTNIGDFSWDFNNSTGTGFQKLPSGMIIQFGTTQIGFNDNSSIGTAKIYYPLAFTKFCKCTGNLETNSYGGYNETNAIVGGQTLSNGYAEVRDIQGRPRTGYTATVTWIAIGI